MSESLLAIIIISAVIMVICLTAIVIVYIVMHPTPLRAIDYLDEDEPEDGDVEPEPEKKALPIDPDNPPTWKEYRPKGESTKACACHGRTLEYGERVLWFPQVDPPGSVLILCAEGVSE